MAKTALLGKVILPGKVLPRGMVVLEEGTISGVHTGREKARLKEAELLDYGDNYIAPGLVDLHVHGAVGKDVMDGEVESLRAIAAHEARCGVTGFLATTMSGPMERTIRAIEAVRQTAGLDLPSEILGIHLEGPFLSQRRRGAQDAAFIKDLDEDDLRALAAAARGLKTLITIAPEAGRNMAFIPKLKEMGFVVSIGHTDATFEDARESFRRGVSHATHFFNAWREFHPRDPGGAGAVLDSDEITAEIIADGIHLHPSTLRLILARKGPEKVCLITDSIKAAGAGEGEYLMGNLRITVRGGEARLKEEGTLAGSVLTLNRAVRNILAWTGVTVSQAVQMGSLNPARVLGLERELGTIEPGKAANITIFDQEFNVIETYLRGEKSAGRTREAVRGRPRCLRGLDKTRMKKELKRHRTF